MPSRDVAILASVHGATRNPVMQTFALEEIGRAAGVAPKRLCAAIATVEAQLLEQMLSGLDGVGAGVVLPALLRPARLNGEVVLRAIEAAGAAHQ
jgi:hypothetical protein